jgi:hypothetical protein
MRVADEARHAESAGEQMSSPLPQLFPHLDKFLDRACAGDAIVHHSTAGIGGVVSLQGRASTKERKAASQLFEIVWTHDFVVAGLTSFPAVMMKVILREVWTARHSEAMVSCSLFVRWREMPKHSRQRADTK